MDQAKVLSNKVIVRSYTGGKMILESYFKYNLCREMAMMLLKFCFKGE